VPHKPQMILAFALIRASYLIYLMRHSESRASDLCMSDDQHDERQEVGAAP
jgi:hypothetical protein